ncbi:MAG: hypothetical protein D6E12_13725 [Desulfovibrio sp.]|nr:MAG: hypothetical protein D6E12_13725 [Desulfovibrio sp.]
MRLLRVRYQNQIFYAALGDGHVVCLSQELGFTDPIPLEELQILPPTAPTKVVCVGLNYKGHAEELGMDIPDEPLIFFKPPSAVIGGGQPIVLPEGYSRVDYEAELAVVMGKPAHHISEDQAEEYIFGYCCANDVTERELQKKDGLYARAKGFDTFAPVGPWIETEVDDPMALEVYARVNGEIRQQGKTSDMIFTPFQLVSFISKVMTLLPGDVILTGTPAGIGPLSPGDEVRVEITEVGVLINPVVREKDLEVKPDADQPPVQ